MKRNMNIELIRVLSCIFVVILHVSNFYKRNIESITMSSYNINLIINAITYICVPLFFMITGALLLNREPKNSIKRTLNGIKILGIWTIIYAIWNYILNDDFSLMNIFYSPIEAHLWYMYALIGIYIALPFMQILYKNMNKQYKQYFLILWFILLMFRYVSAYYGYYPDYDVPFLGGSSYYFGYLFLGSYINEYKNDINKNKSLLLFILSIIGLLLLCFISSKTDIILQYRNPCVIFASMSIFHYILSLDNVFINHKWIEKISETSLGIYLVHIIYLDVFKRINYLSLHSIIGTPLLSIIIFLLSYITVRVYLLLVNKYKKFIQNNY